MSDSHNPAVLAGPPGDHCFEGVKHVGEALGRSTKVADIDTYLSEPPQGTVGPKKVVLYFADVFGPFFNNAKLLQDYFASHGFYVLGIDYFFGDPVHLHADEPGFDRAAWSAKSRKQAQEATPKWIKAARTQSTPLSVRYCFGAPYALEIATTNDVEAAAFAHPSSLNEDHFKNLRSSLCYSLVQASITLLPEAESRRRAEDILAEGKKSYLVQIFSGVNHGFATRGDPNIEHERWAKEESARSVIGWFKRFTA
ncbi:hypothetical protein CVT26_000725 [Gymnopilus dilepis]|uniref:Dienelactone hydrolase domain-containing protein n=1 Tax=Gymnopilus dilepis TaxID=231916 RepID=A0A409YU40_9AGAR|nr:hypothetical protein CVT26_000725 [Gymnopilus dilepis]